MKVNNNMRNQRQDVLVQVKIFSNIFLIEQENESDIWKSDAWSLAEICRAAGYASSIFRARSLAGPRGDNALWKTSRTICND